MSSRTHDDDSGYESPSSVPDVGVASTAAAPATSAQPHDIDTVLNSALDEAFADATAEEYGTDAAAFTASLSRDMAAAGLADAPSSPAPAAAGSTPAVEGQHYSADDENDDVVYDGDEDDDTGSSDHDDDDGNDGADEFRPGDVLPEEAAAIAEADEAAAADENVDDGELPEADGEDGAHGPRYDESLPGGGTVRRRRRSRDEADELPDDKKDLSLSVGYKEEGNRHFGAGEYETAVACYTEALRSIPRGAEHDAARGVFYCNRAACYLPLSKPEEALYDCDRALEYSPGYTKALMRRSVALERLGKLEEAVRDVEAWLVVDPSSRLGRESLERLKKASAERDEKLKEEMMGKLKELGNTILGKFGMSLDNFKAVKDPNTGSYSISFQR